MKVKLAKTRGVPNSETLLRRIADARSLYADGKYCSSLNESKKLIKTLIASICTETDAHGKHSTKLPDGTINRIEYLKNVNFLTTGESPHSWKHGGSLAGSRLVPEREHARIALSLALAFGQLLLLKFSNWKANGYGGLN